MTDSFEQSANKIRLLTLAVKPKENMLVDFLRGLAPNIVHLMADGYDNYTQDILQMRLAGLNHSRHFSLFKMSHATQILYAQKLPDFFFDHINHVLSRSGERSNPIDGTLSKKALRIGVEAARKLPSSYAKETRQDIMGALTGIRNYEYQHNISIVK